MTSCFKRMAKRFTKATVNWKELEKRVPPDQKTNFLAFRGKADLYLRRVLANPAEPPKINWEEYTKKIPISGLVDKMKQGYEGFKVPYPEDKYTEKVESQWKELQPTIKSYRDNMQKMIDETTKNIQRIEAIPKYEDMTMEMYANIFPEVAIDPVNKPTFWPHTPDEQLGYVDPTQKAEH